MLQNGLRIALSEPSDLGPAHFRATKIIFKKTATDKKLGPTAVRQRGRHHLERKPPGEESPFSVPRPLPAPAAPPPPLPPLPTAPAPLRP